MAEVAISIELLADFEAALVDADHAGAARLLRAFPSGSAAELADRLIVPTFDRLGEAFERGDVALSQLYVAGRVCEALLDELAAGRPRDALVRPRLGVAVLEDHHVLGKRVLLSVLRASGHEPVDLGHGIGAEELAQRARAGRLQVLLVSVLMLRSALRVKDLVALLARDGGPPLPVIVGGAPFRLDPKLAGEVSASAFGRSATDAPRLVAEVLGRKAGAP
jgi:methanogenic corrinoid protein MtbC1